MSDPWSPARRSDKCQTDRGPARDRRKEKVWRYFDKLHRVSSYSADPVRLYILYSKLQNLNRGFLDSPNLPYSKAIGSLAAAIQVLKVV